jgi:thymidylate synthase ThyX
MIDVKIIADSLSAYSGKRVTTFELDYPRFIHAEVMTHRTLSRNAQSSRAVPVSSMISNNENFVRPVVYGANKAGMASAEELSGIKLESAKVVWDQAAKDSFTYSKLLADIGLHKQWSNRLTEWCSNIKVIVTATDYDNFFWLRRDPDAAQPEIVLLADTMFEAYENSTPEILQHGEWHVPYVKTDFKLEKLRQRIYLDSNGEELSIADALKISASCCAQVSYRRLNDSKEKALEIYEKLFSGPKPHLSPTEHQAMAYIKADNSWNVWEAGITHRTRKGDFYSGNLNGFIQYRQII